MSRKRNENEDSPNKLYALVTYVAVTTFKNLQATNVDENTKPAECQIQTELPTKKRKKGKQN